MRWIVAGGAAAVATTDVGFLALPAEAPIWPCGRSPACSHPIAVPDVPAMPACDAARWCRCAGGRRWLPIAGPPEKSAMEADELPLRGMVGSTGRVRGAERDRKIAGVARRMLGAAGPCGCTDSAGGGARRLQWGACRLRTRRQL